MEARYEFPDDPRPTPVGAVAVHPQWPLLATMLAGAWLAWPWLAFNAFALGSPTRNRELRTLVVGVAGTIAAAYCLLFAVDRQWLLDPILIRLLLLAIVVWKMSVSYRVVMLQARTAANAEYYGNTVRNGIPIVVLGMIARGTVVGAFNSLLWRLVVSGAWWLT